LTKTSIFIVRKANNKMREDQVIRKDEILENTINIKEVLGKNAISKGGTVVGRVTQIRVNKENSQVEGIVISRGLTKKKIYVGKSYFEKLSHKAVILNTELSVLLKGRRVMTVDGKTIGKISTINRKGLTNDFESVVVRSLWKKFLIPKKEIKMMNNSVILEHKYNESKKYRFKKS
jgi:sporulation protein YlmC with PRC-barrel domain